MSAQMSREGFTKDVEQGSQAGRRSGRRDLLPLPQWDPVALAREALISQSPCSGQTPTPFAVTLALSGSLAPLSSG